MMNHHLSNILKVEVASELFEFLAREILGEAVSWYEIRREIFNLESAFSILLF